MGLIQITSYEEAIDDLLRARTQKVISEGLRMLFSSYWSREQSAVTSEIGIFCKTDEAPIHGKENITHSKLKNYVGKQLITRLQRDSEEDKATLKDRCIVIFKFLKDVYKKKELTSSEIKSVNEALKSIREKNTFLSPTSDKNVKEGAETKYRALANLLKGEVDGEKATLKLAIVVFGIDIAQFDTFLEELKSESRSETMHTGNTVDAPPPAAPSENNTTKEDLATTESSNEKLVVNAPTPEGSTFAQWLNASKYRKALILLLGLALLSVTSFFGYEYLSRPRVNGAGLRPSIKATELFGRQFKINPDDFDISDSLLIMTDTVFTQDLLVGSDTVGLEKLIIKLRLVNLKTDKTYFLDALYLKSDTWGTISGKPMNTGASLNVDSNLEMILDAEQTWPYEWTITSDSSDKGLPPLTEQHTVLKVSGKKNMEQVLVPFTLIFKLHEASNPANTLLIRADKAYKIAFR